MIQMIFICFSSTRTTGLFERFLKICDFLWRSRRSWKRNSENLACRWYRTMAEIGLTPKPKRKHANKLRPKNELQPKPELKRKHATELCRRHSAGGRRQTLQEAGGKLCRRQEAGLNSNFRLAHRS